MAVQECDRGLLLDGRWLPGIGQLVGGSNLIVPVFPCQPEDPAGKRAGPLCGLFPVQERQGLRRRDGSVSRSAGLVRVRQIERGQQRVRTVPLGEEVDAAPAVLERSLADLPSACGRGHSRRQRREDAGPADPCVQQARCPKRRVAQDFRLKPAPRKLPEQPVGRIEPCRPSAGSVGAAAQGRLRRGRLAVGARQHDQPMKPLDTPAGTDELVRQPVEQFRVRGTLAHHSEVAGRGHDPSAEVVQPESVRHHPRRQGILRR